MHVPAVFSWIVGSSLAMSMIALVGSVTLVLRPATLQKLLWLWLRSPPAR